MGNYFANLFIKQNQQTTTDMIKHTLIEHFSARDILPCDADKADFSVMLDLSGRTWGALYCQGWGHEDLLALAPQLSEQCHTDVLSCACFDSDYMFLHLYNADSATDATKILAPGSPVGPFTLPIKILRISSLLFCQEIQITCAAVIRKCGSIAVTGCMHPQVAICIHG